MMIHQPRVTLARLDAIDDFANAVVNPSKGFAKELHETLMHHLYSPCSTPDLLDYSSKLREITSGAEFASFEPPVKKRVLLIHDVVSDRLRKKEVKFLTAISSWLQGDVLNVDRPLLEKVYPSEAEQICGFIHKKAQKIIEHGSAGGKSVSKELYTFSGKKLVVSYRLREKRLQILVHENIREGRFKIFQKVMVVAGPFVQGAPGPLFARLKTNPMLRFIPAVRALVRREASLSSALRGDVRNVVQYALISRKKEGATLATTLYKEDLLDFLDRFPYGPDAAETACKFLSHMAIPVARALSDLHERRVVHLDLKPDNIFLTEEGVAYLGDFGTYRNKGGYEQQEITTQIVSAPEIFTREGSQGWKVTPSLDMWAFGLLLVDLFLGPQRNKVRTSWTPAFDHLPPEEKSAHILKCTDEMLQEIEGSPSYQNDQTIRRLMDLISLLLSSFPDERPRAKDVVKELKAICDAWRKG